MVITGRKELGKSHMRSRMFLSAFTLLFILLLSACLNDDTYEPAEPFEWGEIVQFSLYGGSFHEGSLSYSIIMQEGEYLFSASGWNGLELSIEQQPIPSEEVDALRNLLMESGIEAWNGFAEQNNYVEDGFAFSISFEIENGGSFEAWGHEHYPDDFDAIFPVLSLHLADMAFRYRTVQEWGNLVYMNYYVSHGIYDNSRGFYVYEIYVDSNGQTRISSRVSTTWPRVNGVFDYSVMEDLREIVSRYDIDQWYGDVRCDPENNLFMSVRMRFDDDTSFSIKGNLSPYGFDEANEAILMFLEALMNEAR